MVARRSGKRPGSVAHPRDEDDELDELIARVDAGESVWSDSDEIITLEVKRPLDKVIPVRLTSAHWDALYREARELGVGPTTLARMWILEKLRALPARVAPSKTHATRNQPEAGARRAVTKRTGPTRRGASGKPRRSA